ncbi:MAG: nucleoside kinase [Syntrophomonadaceae bacterium]|nr:nucleoside kinase [Syntrophomonadaceae bacterium]
MTITRDNNQPINVTVKELGSFKVGQGSLLAELVTDIAPKWPYTIVAGIINNTLRDLHYSLDVDCEVELVDTTSEAGLRIYRRSASFLLIKACRDLFPDRTLMIKHTLSNGLFCEFLGCATTDNEIEQIQERMRAIVAQDLPIKKYLVENQEARRIFAQQEQDDKVKLLRYRDKEAAHVYELDGFIEYFYGYMVNRTGVLGKFKLLYLSPGMILRTPEVGDIDLQKPYHEQKKLAMIHQEAKDWAEMLHVPHLAALNEMITKGEVDDIIRVNEALHEKKIAYIADTICANPSIRLVLISGPSSSGKTTFAQRLLIQLRVNGRRPVSVSLDNYFVDRGRTPRDEYGNYDFESLDALDIDLFNDHLTRLIKGEEVEIPIYNFKTGFSEKRGIFLQVPPGEPIIIEGIHGLNERLTWRIPLINKFKIYISALTQLNVDYSNRIPTTDSRLIRRILRDARTRGYSAQNTIKCWPSVRRGEEKNIFTYQENADVMFNSSLVYELAVLKLYVEPLLEAISNEQPEHIEASRLLRFLSYFRVIPSNNIPPNSILREFIGGSWFEA